MKKFLALVLAVLTVACCFASCSKQLTYSDLQIVDLGLEREFFGIAFRKDSDLTRKVEDITAQLIKDGKLAELSTKYEVAAMSADEYVPAAPANSDKKIMSNGTQTDYEYIKAKGKLVVGITDYKPMDYKDDKGEWIGFDADYAKLIAAALGVTVEFKEIEWDNKLIALKAGDVDCLWNGMTLTNEVKEACTCSAPYMYNTQVAVIRKKDADKFKDLKSLEGAGIAAESGSAGEKAMQATDALKKGLKGVTAQTDALLEVLSGASDVAVVDSLLAKALVK